MGLLINGRGRSLKEVKQRRHSAQWEGMVVAVARLVWRRRDQVSIALLAEIIYQRPEDYMPILAEADEAAIEKLLDEAVDTAIDEVSEKEP